jgi:hypothetical protein
MITRRRAARLIAGLGICLLGAGCATIPSSSRPQIISETPPVTRPAAAGDVRYDGIVPRPGEQPEDIVRDFLKVGGSHEGDHARARAYLTGQGSKGWKDDSRVVVLEDSPYLKAKAGGTTVLMGTQQRGQIRSDGSYVPGTALYPYEFKLEKVDGNWRIANPPPGVFVEASTFSAAFRPYTVYFLNSTRNRVVPDVRWYAAASDALPNILFTAIEKGPSAWLTGAVRSDLEGATLQSNVEQVGDRVKVYLTGLAEGVDTLSDGAFAQLVWTLNQLGVGGVEVYIDGRRVGPRSAPDRSLQRLSDWRGFDPEGMPASTLGYFIKDGAVWTTKDAPLAGPAGRPGYGATSVAVSTDGRSLAVVRQARQGGRTLFVGSAAGLRATVSGQTLTAPTWASAVGEVWTVRDGREVVLVTTGGGATRVGAALDGIGSVRTLRLSRDGSRVAVVAGVAGAERLYVGVVIRVNESARIERLKPLDVGELGVSDASWLDALTLVTLVRAGQQDGGLYTVGIDGAATSRLVSRSKLPGPPAAVAAASTLPLLTVAAGTLWQTAPAVDDSWTPFSSRAGADSAPAYPG